MERIYKLSTGKIFKHDEDNEIFYSLNEEGKWVFDPSMLEIYINENYIEISEDDVKKALDKDLSTIPMKYDTLKSGTKIKYNLSEKLYYFQNSKGEWIYYPPLASILGADKEEPKENTSEKTISEKTLLKLRLNALEKLLEKLEQSYNPEEDLDSNKFMQINFTKMKIEKLKEKLISMDQATRFSK